MDDQIRKYLQDILESVDSIDIYLQGKRDFKFYLQQKMLRRSVEREVEIIGEAVNRILKLEPGINISSARKIVGQRNLISHAYDSIDDEMIWGVVVNHLPKLKEDVFLLLGEGS